MFLGGNELVHLTSVEVNQANCSLRLQESLETWRYWCGPPHRSRARLAAGGAVITRQGRSGQCSQTHRSLPQPGSATVAATTRVRRNRLSRWLTGVRWEGTDAKARPLDRSDRRGGSRIRRRADQARRIALRATIAARRGDCYADRDGKREHSATHDHFSRGASTVSLRLTLRDLWRVRRAYASIRASRASISAD